MRWFMTVWIMSVWIILSYLRKLCCKEIRKSIKFHWFLLLFYSILILSFLSGHWKASNLVEQAIGFTTQCRYEIAQHYWLPLRSALINTKPILCFHIRPAKVEFLTSWFSLSQFACIEFFREKLTLNNIFCHDCTCLETFETIKALPRTSNPKNIICKQHFELNNITTRAFEVTNQVTAIQIIRFIALNIDLWMLTFFSFFFFCFLFGFTSFIFLLPRKTYILFDGGVHNAVDTRKQLTFYLETTNDTTKHWNKKLDQLKS